MIPQTAEDGGDAGAVSITVITSFCPKSQWLSAAQMYHLFPGVFSSILSLPENLLILSLRGGPKLDQLHQHILLPKHKALLSFSQLAAESSHSFPAEVAAAAVASCGASVMPPLMASLPATTYLHELVREFGQIRTKLQSPRCPSEPQHLQDQCRIFKEFMQMDFSASFSLKALQAAERALTELYQAQQMTKVQYESFISFFKNLRALRDQHLKAERQANKVRCYKEKHTWTSTTLQQLVEEGSTMKDRIIVVAAEIQKLEEQLCDLKAEETTLSSKLYKKIEEVNIIHSYEDFMPYCKFLKEERFDTYQIPFHGFKMEQFKLFLNDNKGTIKIEGQRPKGGSRWSGFRQKFKLPCNVYNTKDIHASFGNGVLTIRLPKRELLNFDVYLLEETITR
ncbi:hypothetical protein TB1_013028 [Malus domestica]